MNGIFIIPTGLGFEFGGHAGDATPAARLIASVSDKLIVHPNVVNASNIIELTDNMLYVEGSMIDRFMAGEGYLKEVNSNRVLVVVNKPVTPETVNTVSAARAVLGLETFILELNIPLIMKAKVSDRGADGSFSGADELLSQVESNHATQEFDAVAIVTPIEIDKGVELEYFRNGGINPWGGVEAQVSRYLSSQLNKPVAHAPVFGPSNFNEVVDPRMSAEVISSSFLYCVLKGLHKAPRFDLVKGLSVDDIDFLVSPWNCHGKPHEEAQERRIPIILVKENKHQVEALEIDWPSDSTIIVENYLEAAGVIAAMRAGISLESLRRPLSDTSVFS